MSTSQSIDNFRVYSSPAVAEHYGSLNYLTACERFLFSRYLTPGMAILDAGVGGGRTTPLLSSSAERYVGIDFSEAMVERCRARFPKLDFLVADASDLSAFADRSFNAVVMAFNSADYIVPAERRWQSFSECWRVLRPGGLLIFSSHNPRSVLVRPGWNPQNVRSFAERLISKSSVLFPLAISAIAVLKAMHASARAVAASLGRVMRRITKSVFWRGEGHLIDPVHGGLITHYWIPRRVAAELSRLGFRPEKIMGDDYPRRSWILTTDWYYYVFVKVNKSPDCEAPCA
jgi:ubiquinone/menaquinone biosynthesis C-methylase UbiE